jgi:hypothetical protein
MLSPGDVRVLDVGIYGLAIEAPADLDVGRPVCLEMRHERHTVNVEGVVRWCAAQRMVRERGKFLPLLRAGVEFREIHRDEAGGIWDWIMVPDADLPP